MMPGMTKRGAGRVAAGLFSVLIVSAAIAQTDRPVDEPDPLAGPRVHEIDHRPGRPSPFAGPNQRGRRGGAIPMRVFGGAIRSLAGPDTPEEVQLTDQQRAEIHEVFREFAPHPRRGEPMDQDRRGERRGPVGKAGPEAQRRVRAQVWEILTPEQQELARQRIRESMREFRAQHGDRRRPDPRARRGGGEPRAQVDPPPAMQQDAAPLGRARFEKLWGRLENLPPRARERVITRMEKALDRIEQGHVRAPRPAPRMEEVEVPPAEGAQPL